MFNLEKCNIKIILPMKNVMFKFCSVYLLLHINRLTYKFCNYKLCY
jgi:hypothetical protein